MKKVSRIIISVLASVAMATVSTGVVFAGGSEGGVSGGGGHSGCGHAGWTLDTCYGATWRYYKTDSDSVEIKGINKDYAKGGTITGCAAAGGYWRYAMVAYGSGRYSDGGKYSEGDQVGLIGISGNSDRTFNTRMFRLTGVSDPDAGAMNFIGGSTLWNAVGDLYKNAQASGIANLTLGYTPGSNLSWFCSYEDTTPPDTPIPTESVCEAGWNPVVGKETFNVNGVKYTSAVATKFKKNNGAWNVGKTMYAKPDDLITWTHCYFPGAIDAVKEKTIFEGYEAVAKIYQIYSKSISKTAECIRTKVVKGKQCNSEGEPAAEGGNIVASGINVTRDDIVNNDTNWQKFRAASGVPDNLFSVFSTPVNSELITTRTLDNTDSNPAHVVNNYYIKNNEVGSSIANGIVVSVSTVPKSISIEDQIRVSLKNSTHISSIGINIEAWHANGHSAGDGYWDEGIVRVPYNFNLIPTISLSGTAYAGEAMSIKNDDTSIIVGERTNNVTSGTYATVVPEVKAKLKVSICDTGDGNNCTVTYVGNADEVKTVGRMEAKEEKKGIFSTVNVPDTDAGRYFCVRLMVSPYSSNGDTDMNGKVEKWGESAPSCVKVAKRPSFQVWGSSMYANKAIGAGRSVKNNVEGIINYALSGKNDGTKVFGSWVDFAIMANGTMTGLASGRATLGGRSYSGSEDTSMGYCMMESPLTVANYGSGLCPTVAVTGDSGISVTIDRKAILSDMKEANLGRVVEIDRTGSYDSGGKIYLSAADVNGVNGSPVTAGVSKIIHTDGDIVIMEDLRVYDDEEYSSLASIPKLVIFAKNIKIRCNVRQVDAILLAEKNVETCVTESAGDQEPADINLSIRSVPLRVNGVILADSLKLGRTYGAGAGSRGSIPAEVINYDSTMLLWSRDNADSSNTRRMETTYIQELSPRY